MCFLLIFLFLDAAQARQVSPMVGPMTHLSIMLFVGQFTSELHFPLILRLMES